MFKPLILNTPRSAPSLLPTRKLFHWQPDSTLSLHFDWSSLECFLSCNLSAYYKLVLARTTSPRAALAFGAAMHAALEIWYKLRLETEPRELMELCRQGIEHTFSEYKELNLVNEYRTPDYCYECFLKYVAEHRHEALHPVIHESKPLVEFSFALELGDTTLTPASFAHYGFGQLTDSAELEELHSTNTSPIPVSIKWTGICDMLAEINGETWLVDHKTTSVLSADFFDGFNIAMQPVGYVNAVRKAFPELNVAGFLLNVLACRKPTKTGTGYESHRSFHRYEQWAINEWNNDVLSLIEEFMNNLQDAVWPRKTTWCIGKYGKCPYFDCCSMRPDTRSHFIMSDHYTNNTWKPVSA